MKTTIYVRSTNLLKRKTPGQAAVFHKSGQICLGGGTIGKGL